MWKAWPFSWSYSLLNHNKALLLPFLSSHYITLWAQKVAWICYFVLGCLLAPSVHSATVTPESLQVFHVHTYFDFFLLLFKFIMNIYLRCFYFVLEWSSNKCYSIQLLYTISFLARVFPWLIIPVQCTGLGFLLVRYFSYCLILPTFSIFPMDAHYYIVLLECENILLADFTQFCIWAITVLLLFLFVPFSPPIPKHSLSQGRWWWRLWDLFLSLCKLLLCMLFNSGYAWPP